MRERKRKKLWIKHRRDRENINKEHIERERERKMETAARRADMFPLFSLRVLFVLFFSHFLARKWSRMSRPAGVTVVVVKRRDDLFTAV